MGSCWECDLSDDFRKGTQDFSSALGRKSGLLMENVDLRRGGKQNYSKTASSKATYFRARQKRWQKMRAITLCAVVPWPDPCQL